MLALDEHLFNASPKAWLAIDERNQAVRGVVVTSLASGLDLVGHGRVAALVGRLRDGVGVIDVDISGDFGTWISSELTDWLTRQGCWILTRPSGGAEGRTHVFFAHPAYRYARTGERTGLAATISEHLDAFRAEINVPARHVDLRDTVRPLTSPHRLGHHTTPTTPPARALRALKALFPAPAGAEPLVRRARARAAVVDGVDGRAVIAAEFEAWRRPVRGRWRTYLLTGAVPLRTSDRSLVEAACTSELVWAIGDVDAAWRVVSQAHPAAMSKARSHGRSWWTRYVWNPAVEEARTFSESLPARTSLESPAQPRGDVVASVVAGREALARLQWALPPRQRASVLLVGHALLDRVARTGALRVPCPERDLVLDTSIACRKTIRAALRFLDSRLGVLHRDAFDPQDRETSSFEFEIGRVDPEGVGEVPPPVFHPPTPPAGTWPSLPRPAHALWRTLWAAGPLPLPPVTTLAGLTATLGEAPSPSQLTTARASLRALATAGLAHVDADGLWHAQTPTLPADLERTAHQTHTELHAQIETERALYRSAPTHQWATGRERALRAAVARREHWWRSLGDAERRARSHRRRLEFHALPAREQRARTETWRRRRQLAQPPSDPSALGAHSPPRPRAEHGATGPGVAHGGGIKIVEPMT